MADRYLEIGKLRLNTTGSMYYATNVYPEIKPTNQDYYVISTAGDRLDLLAYQFYGDSTLWWIIASANALPGDSLYPPAGMQMRIPYDVAAVIQSYKRKNNGF